VRNALVAPLAGILGYDSPCLRYVGNFAFDRTSEATECRDHIGTRPTVVHNGLGMGFNASAPETGGEDGVEDLLPMSWWHDDPRLSLRIAMLSQGCLRE